MKGNGWNVTNSATSIILTEGICYDNNTRKMTDIGKFKVAMMLV